MLVCDHGQVADRPESNEQTSERLRQALPDRQVEDDLQEIVRTTDMVEQEAPGQRVARLGAVSVI